MQTDKNAHSDPIPVLSFFTGGGFLDMGFEQAGFEVVWTNEINPEFAALYRAGVSSWRKSIGGGKHECPAAISSVGSIRDLTVAAVLSQAFPKGTPDCFGIVGGSPCTDFSVAGTNRGSRGRHGSLAGVFARFICMAKPTFFVFENVPGLVRTAKHRKYLRHLVSKFVSVGYEVDQAVLNALDYGVPQDRSRLFVVGIRRDIVANAALCKRAAKGWYTWPVAPYRDARDSYAWPTTAPGSRRRVSCPDGIPPELTVASAIAGPPPATSLANGNEYFKPRSKKFHTVHEGDTKRKSFKRLHRYRYSPTACYGHREVHLHPTKARRLSLREAMRIQSIPDSYVLPKGGSLGAKFAIVSNAVPVKLAKHVADSMRSFLSSAGV
jgi:DNA (cytosine-5)-methyltransferase 1